MNNLSMALDFMGDQTKDLLLAGHDVRPRDIEIARIEHPGEHGLMATVETKEGGLMAASFLDSECFTRERQEMLTVSFLSVIATTKAVHEVDNAP